MTTPEGRAGAPFTMPVELGKIREFARATKSRNPAYEAGGDRPALAPATFLITAVLWQTPESNPYHGVDRNLERILHGEQEFVFHGPPPSAGDQLTAQSRIAAVYEKEGKRGGTLVFTEQVTEFRDADGRLVAEARNTTIETSKSTTEA
jgi:hypothetical protein